MSRKLPSLPSRSTSGRLSPASEAQKVNPHTTEEEIILFGSYCAGRLSQELNSPQFQTPRWSTPRITEHNDIKRSMVHTSHLRPSSGRRIRSAKPKVAGNRSCPSQQQIVLNISKSKYRILSQIASRLGWCVSNQLIQADDRSGGSDDSWDMLWVDSGLGIENIVRSMHTFQRVNHFPGMVNIYRKDLLAKLMSQMQNLVGRSSFSFTPKTWRLPEELQAVAQYLRSGSSRCIIVKPTTGAQGRGISLFSHVDQLLSLGHSAEPHVAQQYLMRPLLVDGFKFDIRIYVLVVSVEPLRVLLFRNGLCRFCTVPFQKPSGDNLGNTFMHLTNYSINKHNSDFVRATDSESRDSFASKRSVQWLAEWLTSEGEDFELVWQSISHLVVKTMLAVLPSLQQSMKNCKLDGQNFNPFTCFEILGFDVILTDSLKPILLEVNHMPSLSTDSPLDREIKTSLLFHVLSLTGANARERGAAAQLGALESRRRLFGELFGEQETLSEARHARKSFASATSYWQSYLLHENKYMALRNKQDQYGKHFNCFDLVYPVVQGGTQHTSPFADFYARVTERLANPNSPHSEIHESKFHHGSIDSAGQCPLEEIGDEGCTIQRRQGDGDGDGDGDLCCLPMVLEMNDENDENEHSLGDATDGETITNVLDELERLNAAVIDTMIRVGGIDELVEGTLCVVPPDQEIEHPLWSGDVCDYPCNSSSQQKLSGFDEFDVDYEEIEETLTIVEIPLTPSRERQVSPLLRQRLSNLREGSVNNVDQLQTFHDHVVSVSSFASLMQDQYQLYKQSYLQQLGNARVA